MSKSKLTIKKQLKGDIGLLVVSGYLDAHTFEELEESITSCFEENIHKIIVSLEGVDYISSAGAGVFIGALSEAQESDGNIVMLKPSERVTEVLDLIGLTQVFTIVDDLKKAVIAFKQN